MKPFLILFFFTCFLWPLSIWAVGVLGIFIGLGLAWVVFICIEWKYIKLDYGNITRKI